MGDHIFLKVPNWEEPWKVKLSKSPCGNHMWLEEGWKAFTQFYLLEEGELLVFNYDGEHSHFRVRIIGWDDMEIHYPSPGMCLENVLMLLLICKMYGHQCVETFIGINRK